METREEAHQKAKKRLREKNKNEYQASFTLVGDVKYVAGATVDIAGWDGFERGRGKSDGAGGVS
ncbi:MAG: hypothetical protein FWF94_04910 [Oscillospiraceae bacterium]|nr:hypothetical protein [Oscillospiraceae bacterium]